MAKKFYKRNIGVAILAVGLAPGASSDEVWAARDLEPQVMEGQIFQGGMAEKELAERAVPRRLDPSAAVTHEMRLEPMIDLERLEKSDGGKGWGAPLRIGADRELPAGFTVPMEARDLTWEEARGGGQVAVFSVSSPGAKALRVALDFERLPRGAEVRFYSPSEPVAAGGSFEADFLIPSNKGFSDAGPFWSPAVTGETMMVEIWVPEWRRASDVRVALRQLTHIYRSIDAKDLSHLGNSASCNRDVQCFNKWTTAGNAVAKIIFSVPGGAALCTGQMMANEAGKLLFLTAAHCISSKASAASTTFFWFFERGSCNGANPTSVTQTAGGAKLLFTSASNSAGLVTDHTLMQVKRDPPNGVAQLGWAVNADPEDNVRQKTHGVHHPAGDVKRASRGKINETWQNQTNGSLVNTDPPTHYQVNWNKGTTEGGSSGSAIMTGKKWPQQFVVGVLTGGLASCSQKKEPDFYGMFEETFRRFKKFRKHF